MMPRTPTSGKLLVAAGVPYEHHTAALVQFPETPVEVNSAAGTLNVSIITNRAGWNFIIRD